MRSIHYVTSAAILSAALFGWACGGRSHLAPSPEPPQVGGAWLGEQNVTSLDGADCLDDALHDLLTLPTQFRGTFVQDGRAVTATLDIDHAGSTCSYGGMLDGDSLTLTSAGCGDAHIRALRCSTGQLRDIVPASEVLHGTLHEGVYTGSATERDDVMDSETSGRVSTLVAQSTFRLVRQ